MKHTISDTALNIHKLERFGLGKTIGENIGEIANVPFRHGMINGYICMFCAYTQVNQSFFSNSLVVENPDNIKRKFNFSTREIHKVSNEN